MTRTTSLTETLESRLLMTTVEFAVRTDREISFDGTDSAPVIHGDFNGDGRADVALRGGRTGSVYLLDGRPDGSLGPPRIISTTPGSGESNGDITAADMNGDGIDELVVEHVDARNRQELRVYSLHRPGAPRLAVTVPVTKLVGLGSGDFNGDGRDDVLLIRAASSDAPCRLSAAFSNGRGYEPAVALRGNYQALRDSAVADLTGDGLADIALADSGGYLHVITARSHNRFGAVEHRFLGNDSVARVAAGDVNNDGRADLAVSGAGMTSADPNGGGEVDVFTSNTAGRLTPAFARTLNNPLADLAVADIDGDGLADVLARQQVGDVTFFYSDGDGGSGESQDLPADGYLANSPALLPADVDADGRNDLIQLDTYLGALTVRLNTATR